MKLNGMGKNVARMEEMRTRRKSLIGIPERRRPFGRSRRRWEDSIKWVLEKYRVDWIHLAQDMVQCEHDNTET
jgi:hypothetical protein